MHFKYCIRALVLGTGLIVFSYAFLDVRIALFVTTAIRGHAGFSAGIAEIPDLLLISVCIISATTWIAYFYEKGKAGSRAKVQFLLLVATAVPLAFILKTVLKLVFGRTNTMVWLYYPDGDAFHWFRGGGDFNSFPSGHMAVYTALAVALWNYYPKYRFLYSAFLLLLAAALILTNYHFLSDIIAGVCLGVIIVYAAFRGLAMLDAFQKEPGSGM